MYTRESAVRARPWESERARGVRRADHIVSRRHFPAGKAGFAIQVVSELKIETDISLAREFNFLFARKNARYFLRA